jgi:hypothetical protein
MKALNLLLISALALAFLAACGGSQDALTHESPENSMLADVAAVVNGEENELVISFDFEKQSGWASNQFAVWIEDAKGNYVESLYVTAWAADGGAEKRAEVLSTWVNRSGLTGKPQAEIDAVSSATPDTGALSYTWDFADYPDGEYSFFVEGNLRWANRVIFSGTFTTGADVIETITAEAEYFYQ